MPCKEPSLTAELEAAVFTDTHTSWGGGWGSRWEEPWLFLQGHFGPLGRRASEPECGLGGPLRRQCRGQAGAESHRDTVVTSKPGALVLMGSLSLRSRVKTLSEGFSENLREGTRRGSGPQGPTGRQVPGH